MTTTADATYTLKDLLAMAKRELKRLDEKEPKDFKRRLLKVELVLAREFGTAQLRVEHSYGLLYMLI